jgi:DNA (cytosine-5)-methyltransferase 1
MRSQFKDLGYGLSGCILNSANYGVPQKRERFIMIGMRGGHTPYMPLPTHSKDKKIWAAFVENLAPAVNYDAQSWVTVGQAFKAIPSKLSERADYTVMNISPMVKARMRRIKHGENFHALPMEMRPQCWQTGKHQGQDTFGRLHPDQPSVTIRTAAYNPAKGRYIHPFENRGLSTHELAALQGFPTEWEFCSAKYDTVTLVSGGMQIGNAVPPPLGRALGLAVRKQLHLCNQY